MSRAPSGLDWDRKTGFMAGVRRAARRGEDRPCPRIGSAAHRCTQVRRRRRGLADRLGFDADLAPLREIDWSRRAKDAVLIDGMDRSHGQAPTRSQRSASRLVLLTVLGADPRPRAGASRPAQMHAYRRRCADCASYWEQQVCGRMNQALIASSRRSAPGVGATRLGSRSQEERVGSCPIARP